MSSLLTEHFCSSCHWWLKETHDKINGLKDIGRFWNEYLKVQDDLERIKEESNQDKVKTSEHDINMEDGYKVEYLDVDMCTEDELQHAKSDLIHEHAFQSHCNDTNTNQPNDGLIEEASSINNYEDLSDNIVRDDHLSEIVGTDSDKKDSTPSHEAKNTSVDYSDWNIRDESAECDLCGQQFRRKHNLTKHFIQRHQLQRHFSCQSCLMVFSTK